MKRRDLIQASVEPKLFNKVESAGHKRGYKKVGTFNRLILTELDNKGYFESPLNEIFIKKK